MQLRKLGSQGLVSSAIGLGTLAFTGVHGPVSKRDCIEAVRFALDIGITMVDTASFYAHGRIEQLLGESLAGRRDGALIAAHGGVRPAGAGRAVVVDASPESLAADCEESLRRLKTDRIDLFYLSRVDPRVPVEDSVGKLAELVAAGKIRYIGLHDASADELRRAQAAYPISALAVEYSLRKRVAEKGPIAAAAELGIGVVAYCPLDGGNLATGVSSAAPLGEQASLRELEEQAAELDLGMARLALGWLLGCREDVVPVPSTRSLAHLEMNASAVGIRLTPTTCARMTALFPP
jgi:aryl-alcohol dehydrogenase-like predicted oxidoreductase